MESDSTHPPRLNPKAAKSPPARPLLDHGVHQYVISALLGQAMPVAGFGHASRITPGYAHATWEAMVEAVESLEYPATLMQNAFAVIKNQMQVNEGRKAS